MTLQTDKENHKSLRQRAVWPGHNKIHQSHSHNGYFCSFSSECKRSANLSSSRDTPVCLTFLVSLILICEIKYFTCLLQRSAHRSHVPEATEVVPHAGNRSWKYRSHPGCPHFEGMMESWSTAKAWHCMGGLESVGFQKRLLVKVQFSCSRKPQHF